MAAAAKAPGHDREQLYLLLHQLAPGQRRRRVRRRIEQRGEVREIANLDQHYRVVWLPAQDLAQQRGSFWRIRAAAESVRIAELASVLGFGEGQELARLVGQVGMREAA